MTNQRTLRGLGRLQSTVMEYLWAHGEGTVSQVAEHVGQDRTVTYTTVLAAMQRLEKKGWLGHRQQGRAYVYFPRRTQAAVDRGVLCELVDTVFRGDPKLLIANLLDAHPLAEQELLELRKLIDQRRREQRHGKRES